MHHKELKRQYKETPRNGGIYQVLNKETGQRLIGKSMDIEKAFNKDQAQLKFGAHRSKQLQQDFNTLGMEGFEFKVLEILERKNQSDQEMQQDLETMLELWLEKLALPDEMYYQLN